jgi:hypothetical protein
MSDFDFDAWQKESDARFRAASEKLNGTGWDAFSDPETLKLLFNGDLVVAPLWADVGHLGTFSDDPTPPLTLRVTTCPDGLCETQQVIYEVDLIDEIIAAWGDPAADESARAAFDRAYAALQSGIDRLRAYEAECRKAQS